MKSGFRGFVMGIVAAVLVYGAMISASATVGSKLVELDYNDIKVTLDGEAVNLVDANGTAVEPFAINGTTYLPVRAVSSALGLGVQWDGETNTVILSSKDRTEVPVEVQSGYNGERHLLSPGQVIDAGGYIVLDGVEFLYDGEKFIVTNNRDDYILPYWDVVGVKKDGTHEDLLTGMLYGIDTDKYQKDYEENGWAVEHTKTFVKPGERMESMKSSFDTSSFMLFDVDADVDKDGYYDIVFRIIPQKDGENFVFSTENPGSESDVYRIAANQ